MTIPVFKPYFDEHEKQAAVEAIDLGWLGPGSYVKQFEEKIAQLMQVDIDTVVAVNTGTSAVHLALHLCGVTSGDEVITPSFNNIADFQMIRALGADPVFCDVKNDDLTIDSSTIESLISKKTKAIICIDYGAALCDYSAVKEIGDRYNIPVIYDAAHSFGSLSKDGRFIGGDADFCCFSFDPVKNITCIDGGAVIIKDKKLAERARYMRLIGQKQNQEKLYGNGRSWTYDVEEQGYRYHLANLHGAIGLVQLQKIDDIRKKRQKVFKTYYQSLQDIEDIITPPMFSEGVLPFIFVMRILNNKRSAFRDFLKENNIDTGIHWQPGHLFSYFSSCKKGPLPVTDALAHQIVTLPMFPELKEEELEKIIKTVQKFFKP